MWSQNVHSGSLALEPLIDDAVITSDHHEDLEEGIRMSKKLKQKDHDGVIDKIQERHRKTVIDGSSP